MKTSYILFLNFWIGCLICHSSVIEPTNSIVLHRNIQFDLSNYDNLTNIGLYNLKFTENSNITLSMTYLGIWETTQTSGCCGSYSIYIRENQQILFDLSNHTILKSNHNYHSDGTADNELIHDATRVFIQDQWSELENTNYYEESKSCYSEGIYRFFCYIKSQLDRITLSSNNKYIGGTIGYIGGGYYDANWYILVLWDVETGKSIYLEDNKLNLFFTDANKMFAETNCSFEVRFSPDNRFFYTRGINRGFNIVNQLINIKTLETIPVSRDVAFTSDSRYYVTDRDGMPTLVEAHTGKTIQQYKIPSPMTAATFSPDNQKLYIAVETNKMTKPIEIHESGDPGSDTIYIFDSRLPNSSVPDWDCME